MSELPDSWLVLPFGELNQFSSSTVDPSAQPDQVFELYSVPSFPSGRPELALGSAIGSTKQTVAPRDVLISKINPRINRVWTVGPKTDKPQIASSEWIGFRSTAVQPAYANYYFKSPDFRDLLCSEVAGVGGSLTRAQPKRVAAYSVPVAPLAEQTRIADHLDTLLARIKACNDHLDAIPGLLRRFRQAVLDAAVTGSLTNDWREANDLPEWKDALIADCGLVTGGLTKNSKRESLPLRKPYLRVANVQSNRLDLADVAEIGLTHAEHEKTRLQRGDLLIVEGNGSIDQVGRVAIWSDELEDCVHQNHLIRLRPVGARSEWLLYWLLSSLGRTALMERASTTTGLYTLSISKISSVPIRLPSPQEQSEIVGIVQKLLAVAEQIEALHRNASLNARQLAPRTLGKAFRGELLPQDPNDEPASVLLARLAAARNQVSAAPKARKARAPRAEGTLPSKSSPSKAMPTKSRQDEDVKGQPYLAAHLRRLGQPVDAKTLYEASELPVADFYKQLAWEIAEGHVNDADPLLEPARHAA